MSLVGVKHLAQLCDFTPLFFFIFLLLMENVVRCIFFCVLQV